MPDKNREELDAILKSLRTGNGAAPAAGSASVEDILADLGVNKKNAVDEILAHTAPKGETAPATGNARNAAPHREQPAAKAEQNAAPAKAPTTAAPKTAQPQAGKAAAPKAAQPQAGKTTTPKTAPSQAGGKSAAEPAGPRVLGDQASVDKYVTKDFETFFRTPAAVIPGQKPAYDEEDGDYESDEDDILAEEPHRASLFHRFVRRSKTTQERPEAEVLIPEPTRVPEPAPIKEVAQPAKNRGAAPAAETPAVREPAFDAPPAVREPAFDAQPAVREPAPAAEKTAAPAPAPAAPVVVKKSMPQPAAQNAAPTIAPAAAPTAAQAVTPTATPAAAPKAPAVQSTTAESAASAAQPTAAGTAAPPQGDEQNAALLALLGVKPATADSADESTLSLHIDLTPTQEVRLETPPAAHGMGSTVQLEKLGMIEGAEFDEDDEESDEEPQKPHRLPRLFGRGRDEAEGDEPPFADDAEPEALPDDYTKPEDAPAIAADLQSMCARLALRTALTAILFAALFYLGIAGRGAALPLLEMIDPQIAPMAFLGVNLILLIAAGALCRNTLQNGLVGLFGEPSPDTVPAAAVVGALVQLVAFLAAGSLYDPNHITVFASPAVLLLCINSLGKLIMGRAVQRNFELVSAGVDHAAAYLLSDAELSKKLTAGLEEETPVLLVSRPAGLVKNFLAHSFSPHSTDLLSKKLGWVLVAAAVACAGVSLAMKGGAGQSVSVFAAVLCFGGPLALTAASALPTSLAQKAGARVGAVVPGWSAVRQLGSANVVQLSAEDLFPRGCIHLHGIKTFEKERIDLAILYAASVLQNGSPAMREVFLSILQNDTGMLFETEGVTHEAGMGISAWIEHQRVIVGNREMMSSHGIEIPSMDYENRYTKGQRSPIYLAVSGKLFGMFLVSYVADESAAKIVNELRESGISLLVRSDDFCLTTETVENAYHLPGGSVKVLSFGEETALRPATEYLSESEGCMVHLGSFVSFAGGLRAAASAKRGERAAGIVMTVSAVLSCVLSLLLSFAGGLAGLVLPAVVLYQAAWCVLALAMPAFQKY